MLSSILITGASSGFGEACAHKFAEAGYPLILVARRIDKLNDIKARLEQNCPIHISSVDVRDQKQVEQLFQTLPEEFKDIDILINSAGLALGLEPAHEADMDNWKIMVETNINGLLHVSKEALSGMVARNKGHIINIGSIAGSWPYPGGNVYGATKSFVQSFSQALRADLIGKRIRISNIDPGLADTNFSTVRFMGDRDKADQVYKDTKPLTAEDIANIIFWTTSLPEHVNINNIEVMPVCQAWSAMTIDRSMENN